MAFSSINTNEIATGEPVSNTTQTKIKDNFDNLDTRVTSLEGGGNTIYPPIILSVNGAYHSMNGAKGVLKTTCNFNLTVTGVRLLIDKAGSAGTTEINVEYKRGAGSWTSILTTNPSVAYTEGDDSISSNTVLDSGEVELEAGDLIRVNIVSAQSYAKTFQVRIDFSKT
jgi:hypothetical protein